MNTPSFRRIAVGHRSTATVTFITTFLSFLCAIHAPAQEKQEQPPSMHISLTPDNQLLVQGRLVKLSQLPSQLKKEGATRETPILVAVDKNTPATTLKAISGKLRSEGYSRVIFTRPQYVDARVDTNARPRTPLQNTTSRSE